MWKENEVVPPFDSLTEQEMRELVSDQGNTVEATPATVTITGTSGIAISRVVSSSISRSLGGKNK